VVGTNAGAARATRGRAYRTLASVPARSFAIVPGARVYGLRPYMHLEARLEAALALYRAGRVKTILVSGNDTPAAPEVTAMIAWLRERGVARADIVSDGGGSRTRATMNRAAGLFDVRDAVICTQDVNAARSLYLADHAGIDAVAWAVPSDLDNSAQYMRNENFKTTLALFESLFGRGPEALAGERERRSALAAR